MKALFRFLLYLVMTSAAFVAKAYNMRQLSNIDGLSSSAILSMAHDSDGFLWIGTCDGVYIADGSTLTPLSTIYPGITLSGNFIEKIVHIKDGPSWVLTNHGLDRIDMKAGNAATFPQFNGREQLCVNNTGDMFAVTADNRLLCFRNNASGFESVATLPGQTGNVKSLWCDNGKLYVVSGSGLTSFTIKASGPDGAYAIGDTAELADIEVNYAKPDGNGFIVLTAGGQLCKLNLEGSVKNLTDLSAEVKKRGRVSDIAIDRRGNIFISFLTAGVIRIKPSFPGNYSIDDIGLKAGVFCLDSSDRQNVVWIGSDCHGLYTLGEYEYSITSVNFPVLDKMISHPVRALYLDSDSTLWVGTKGSGLLRIHHFDERDNSLKFPRKELLLSENSNLIHNSVFALSKSSRPVLWIATEEGINYYDYRDKRLKRIAPHPLLRFVQDIREENDSTLLLATLGLGLVKAHITDLGNELQLTNIRNYVTDNGNFSSNYFFSMSPHKKHGLLLGNRGLGVFRFDGDSLQRMPFREKYEAASVNDVFTVISEGEHIWAGTGHGLIKSGTDGESLFFGAKNGFTNNTIHDILADNDGCFWISTNNGLIKFNPETNHSQVYNRNYGLTVAEFSDGASFRSEKSLMFGGVDGFVVITKTPDFVAENAYIPALTLQRLNILGQNVNPNDHITRTDGHNTLTLDHTQNHFSVKFVAPDFIDASNYSYLYTLDGKDWINNGDNPVITFNGMEYGNYTLGVKYLNRTTGMEGHPCILDITIRAPWYLSTPAKCIYILLLAAMAFGAIRIYIRRQKERQEKELARIEHTHREELYEEKLKFFTNITHEFCTPITLIYGPCERILNYDGADDYIKKYVGLIRGNAERLNTLIQELIDFRRMETGHKILKIRSINITEICEQTIGSFIDLAERNNIGYTSEITPDVTWNSDFSGLRKILNNLISNAFKYTPVGGDIKVGMDVADNNLRIFVYNTGKGLREEDKKLIFNRYSVFDNVDGNAVKGLSSRNGLGMAICHSIVELLGGRIDIDSEVGKYVKFTVILPMREATDQSAEKTEPSVDPSPHTPLLLPQPHTAPAPQHGQTSKPTILVVDDNEEILTLLTDSLKDYYNIICAESAQEGLQSITDRMIDCIITDVMMPGTNGLDFTRQIKNNRHTMHIPVIILSAKNSVAEKVEGVKSGADVYVGKPFSLSYLKAVVDRLLSNRNVLKDYYNSSASAYEFNNGKLLEKADKDFINKVNTYIDEHLDDSLLSPETLATHMQTSIRNLYRRFKDLEQAPPKDFIKNRRMAHAAKLLLTTSMTVQEIMYAAGFTNRSHFYKEFDKRYSMTPRDYRNANKMKDPSLTD